MKKIGFIGVGLMGKSMVRNLMKAGFAVQIYARHPEKVQDVAAEGAKLHESIAACVADCQAVITMVGFPKDVEEIYFQPGGILDSAAAGTYLIDMTTTSPTLAEKLYAEGTARASTCWTRRSPAAIPARKMGHSQFWWAVSRGITRRASPCSGPWGLI